jgi:hypothetical protein
VDRAKPFDIPKREVWEAYKRVRANQGTAGVDGESIASPHGPWRLSNSPALTIALPNAFFVSLGLATLAPKRVP